MGTSQLDELVQALLVAQQREERQRRDMFASRLGVEIAAHDFGSEIEDILIWSEIGRRLSKQQHDIEANASTSTRLGRTPKPMTSDERLRDFVIKLQAELMAEGENRTLIGLLRELQKRDDVWKKIKLRLGYFADVSPEDLAARISKAKKKRKPSQKKRKPSLSKD